MITDSLTHPGGTSDHTAIASSPSTTGIKRPRGRPTKDQQPSQTTTTNSLDPTPPTLSDDAVSMRAKRLIARQTKETPPAAPKTGIKRGRGRPRKDKSATPMSAETGGAVSTRIKSRSGRPRKIKRRSGRPRKDKSAAAISAEAGGAASTGIKRRRGRPRKKRPSTAYPCQESSSGDHRRNEDVERHSGVGSAEPLPGETEQHLGDAEMEVNTGNGDSTQADPPYLEPQTVALVPSKASLQISKEVEAEANLVMQSAQPIVAPAQPLQRAAEQVDRSGITAPQTLQPEMQQPTSREAYTQTDLVIQSAQPSMVPTGLSQRDAEQASLSRVPSSQCLTSAMHSSVPPSSILLERAHPDQCQPPSHQPEAAPGSSPQIFPVAPIMFNHPPVGDDPLENELHRLRLHIDLLNKTHQLKQSQLRTECSQEMVKLKQKYDLLLQEQDSTHLHQTKALDNLREKVLLNQSLAGDLGDKFASSGEQVVESPTASSSAARPPVRIHHVQPLQVDRPSPSSSPSSQVVRPHPSMLSNIVRSASTSFSLAPVLPRGSFGVQSELAHAHAPRLQHRLPAQVHSMAPANQQQLPTGLESMSGRTWSTPVTPINIRQSCPHAVPPGNPSLSSLHPSSHSTIPAPLGPSSSHQIQQVPPGPPLPSSSQATILAPVGPSSSHQIQQVPPLPSSSQPTRLPLPVPSNPNPVLPLTLPRGLTTTSSVSSAASSVLPSKGVGPCASGSPQSDSDPESLDQFLTSLGVPSDPHVAAPQVICLSDDDEGTDDQTKQETPLVAAEVLQQKVPCKFLVKGDACKQEKLMPRSIL